MFVPFFVFVLFLSIVFLELVPLASQHPSSGQGPQLELWSLAPREQEMKVGHFLFVFFGVSFRFFVVYHLVNLLFYCFLVTCRMLCLFLFCFVMFVCCPIAIRGFEKISYMAALPAVTDVIQIEEWVDTPRGVPMGIHHLMSEREMEVFR